MEQIIKNIFAILIIVLFISCGNNNSGVKISPEMQSFMQLFDGKYTGVSAAIQKYEADSKLNTRDMDTKDLRDPKVTASTENAGQTCYTLTANDGIKDCTYSVCWKGGKIISIEEKL